MQNKDLIQFVLDHKKVQYDPSFFNSLAKQYFILTIQEIEQSLDFHYMRGYIEFTLPEGQYTWSFPNDIHVKNIKNLVDKRARAKLGPQVFDVEVALVTPPGIPSSFWYAEGTIYFNRKAARDLEYVAIYYRYTYNDPTLTDLNNTHPLVKNYFNLCLYRYSAFVDHFYNDSEGLAEDLQLFSMELLKVKRSEFTATGRNAMPKFYLR